MANQKHLLLLLAVCSLFSLGKMSGPINHCGGFCTSCGLVLGTTTKVCTACFNSNLVFIDGLNVKGGKCEGEMPLPGCAIITYNNKVGENICSQCKPKFVLAGDFKSCSQNHLAHCVVQDGENCRSCEENYRPDSAGQCEAISTTYSNCIAYKRLNTGDPSCTQCSWEYYRVDFRTCTLRASEGEKTCLDPGQFLAGGCDYRGCNVAGGYFATNYKFVPSVRRRINEEAGPPPPIMILKSLVICVRNPDFDPDHPFRQPEDPSGNPGELLTSIQSTFVCLIWTLFVLWL